MRTNARLLNRLDSSMVRRVLTALIGIPVVVAIVIVGGGLYEAVVVMVALGAAWEGFRLLRAREHHPAWVLGMCMAGLLAIAPATSRPLRWWQATVLLGVIACGVWFLATARGHESFMDWVVTVAVTVYVGGLSGMLIAIRLLNNGLRLALLVLILTWAYDTGAYLTGRAAGRTPFMQNVSQSKTWEGVAGGLATSIIVALVAAVPCHVPIATAFVIAVAVAIAAQAGDLVESLMKRYAGVKDSGGIIPGHGGLLDRIDGLLFSGTAAYYIFLLAGYR